MRDAPQTIPTRHQSYQSIKATSIELTANQGAHSAQPLRRVLPISLLLHKPGIRVCNR